MQRLYSESGYHDFATGPCAGGPNAFVQCESRQSLGESGAIDSAASGVLFDRVRIDGHALSLRNRGSQGQGVGWSSFNGVLWNCSASMIHLETPPLARNWAFGAHGEYNGDGTWINSDDNVSPESLYYAQLAERIGKENAQQRSLWIRPPVQGSRASTPEQALEASQYSKQPRMTVSQWIDLIQEQTPIAISTAGLPLSTIQSLPEKRVRSNSKPLSIQNGWLTLDGKVAVGREASVPWWNGGVRPDDLSKASPALTRFVPVSQAEGSPTASRSSLPRCKTLNKSVMAASSSMVRSSSRRSLSCATHGWGRGGPVLRNTLGSQRSRKSVRWIEPLGCNQAQPLVLPTTATVRRNWSRKGAHSLQRSLHAT